MSNTKQNTSDYNYGIFGSPQYISYDTSQMAGMSQAVYGTLANAQQLQSSYEHQVLEMREKVRSLEIQLKKANELIEELGYKPEYF